MTSRTVDCSWFGRSWLFALCTALLAAGGCQHGGYGPVADGYFSGSHNAPGTAAPSTDSEDAAERPGLGTAWGENRISPVRKVSFERQGRTPAFLASLLYNDAEGVEALRARIGRRYRAGEPMFRAFRGSAASSDAWQGVVVSVVDDEGRMLPAYHLDDRVLLVGEMGQRYVIEVDNRTEQRFEIVASVDGLDVVDGRTASLDKSGYVVEPHGHLSIDGYRRSLNEVAAFRFGSVRGSYAARSAEFGDRHVGVIGVALFAERGADALRIDNRDGEDAVLREDEEAAHREAANPFPGRFAQPPPKMDSAFY